MEDIQEEILGLKGRIPLIVGGRPLNGWKICFYCDKEIMSKYYIKNTEYCCLCWSWLNNHNLNLETGEYKGDIEFKDVKEMIKKVIPIYEKLNARDKNDQSIFFQILEKEKNNKLHISILKLFRQIEEPKDVCKEIKVYKPKIIEIDYERSEIVI